MSYVMNIRMRNNAKNYGTTTIVFSALENVTSIALKKKCKIRLHDALFRPLSRALSRNLRLTKMAVFGAFSDHIYFEKLGKNKKNILTIIILLGARGYLKAGPDKVTNP